MLRTLQIALLVLCCLATANVNADILVTNDVTRMPEGNFGELYTVQLKGQPGGFELTPTPDDSGANTPYGFSYEGNSLAGEYTFTFNIEGNVNHFSLSGRDNPVYNVNVNGESLFDTGNLWSAYKGDANSTVYFTGLEDDLLTLSFDSVWTTQNPYNISISFYGTPERGNSDAPTPEPATMLIFGIGLAGAGVAAYRRRSKK